MTNLFNQPFRSRETPRQKFVSIVVFGLFIFLFLFFFRPFGMAQMESKQILYFTFGFGVVTTFMLIIFKYLLEPVVTRGNWTFGKNILWDLLIASSIGVANYFYISIIYPEVFLFKYLLTAILTAILVGVLPVTITYFVKFNRIYRTALIDAAIVPDEILWESEVIITAGNPKNEFSCNPKHIVYLCSNDNYVTIVTIKGETLNKTTIRGTLKSVESELSNNTRFLRCHKCYIVNLDFVYSISGHNQNMKIKLLPAHNEIPVSRQKAELLNKKVKKS